MLPGLILNKKKSQFSNPLSGTIYNNNTYLKQCDYELDYQLIQDVNPKKKYKSNNHHFNNKPSHCIIQQNYVITRLSNGHPSHPISLNNQTKQKCSNDKASKTNKISIEFQQNEIQIKKQEKDVFIFPDIDIKIIDQIYTINDITEKCIKINLGNYFGLFFKKNMMGTLNSDFIYIVQKYMQILAGKGKLDDITQQPKSCLQEHLYFKSKRQFLEKVEELESKKNFRGIEQIIKLYCVPSAELRQSYLKDILHMVNQLLYEKFNLRKSIEYVLLDENGNLIKQICEIKFQTKVLLASNKLNYQKSFNKYKNISQSNLLDAKKYNLTESLKQSFQAIIDDGKMFLSCHPYGQNQPIKKKKSSSRTNTNQNSDKVLQKYQPSKTTGKFPTQKSQQKKIRAKSSIGERHSLDQLINNKVRTVHTQKRYVGYQEAFNKLKSMNNRYDVAFNYINQDKLIMGVLKQQYQLFKNKTIKQINAILTAFKINPNNEFITKQQFVKINEVVKCKGQHKEIVEFVSRYLPFNQYGELQRSSLQKTLKFVLNNVNGNDVVLNIIWNWLQKNNLIDNGVLVRNTLQSWYQKNKMAFVIITSFIFGTNQQSLIDMAYDQLT